MLLRSGYGIVTVTASYHLFGETLAVFPTKVQSVCVRFVSLVFVSERASSNELHSTTGHLGCGPMFDEMLPIERRSNAQLVSPTLSYFHFTFTLSILKCDINTLGKA